MVAGINTNTRKRQHQIQQCTSAIDPAVVDNAFRRVYKCAPLSAQPIELLFIEHKKSKKHHPLLCFCHNHTTCAGDGFTASPRGHL